MLVEMLFDSGLCQSCDAAVRKGTAAVGGRLPNLSPPTRRAKTAPASAGPAAPKPIATPGTCSHGCGRPRHRGRCAKPRDPNAKPKRAYKRRKKPSDAERLDAGLLVDTTLRGDVPGVEPFVTKRDDAILTRMRALRQQRADAVTAAETELAARRMELAVMDDLFEMLKLNV